MKEIKVNKIYRYGDSLVRVADVNGDEITLVTGAVTTVDQLHTAIPMGTLLEMIRMPYKSLIAGCDHDYLDDDSWVNGIRFFDDDGNQMLKVISYPKPIEVGDKLYKLVQDFFDNTKYDARTEPLTKILGEWKRNKNRLARILKLSPYWDEESLALVWEIEIPDCQRRELAKEVHDEIMHRYYGEFNSDYNHAYKFGFSDFFDIEDNRKFKAVNIKIACHAKPSRALRKYYEAIGAHRIENFEKLYARLSDALSDKKLKRKITLSIHPLDFLRMSYGNSWDSCHHVGRGGCYSNGTLSYLMDEDAMVCTLLPTDSDEPTFQQKKINRMMFFLNKGGDILQSRLYPQTRIPELEKILAEEVCAKLKEVLKIEGEYKAVVSDTDCDYYVWSIGKHYHDYDCRDFGQNIWSVKEKPTMFKIGHPSYCVTCGNNNISNGSLSCGCYTRRDVRESLYYVDPNTGVKIRDKKSATLNEANGKYYIKPYFCKECGKMHFDKDELYCPECRKTHKMVCDCGSEEIEVVYNGKAYCSECAAKELRYCEDCGDLGFKEDIRVYDDHYLCSDCLENQESLERCEDCGEYYDRDDMYYIGGYGYICNGCRESGDYYTCDDCGEVVRLCDGSWVGDNFVCDSCLEEYYTRCNECGEYYRDDDMTRAGDGEYYCEDCLDEYFTRCDECGEYVRNGCIREVNGDRICDECFESEYAECSVCGEVFRISDLKKFDNGYICEDCLDEKMEEGEDDDKEYGILTRNIDARFREGQRVRIVGKSVDWYKVELENGSPVYRYIETTDIKEETVICA